MTPEERRHRIGLAALQRLNGPAFDPDQDCVLCGSDSEPREPIYGTNPQLFACVYHGEENEYPERTER